MEILSLIFAASGAVLGALAAWYVQYNRMGVHHNQVVANFERDIAVLRERLLGSESQVMHLEQDTLALQEKIQNLESEKVDLITRNREVETRFFEQTQAAQEKLAGFQQMEVQMRDVFKSLSSEALRDSCKQFVDIAEASIGKLNERNAATLNMKEQAIHSLLQPIRESLTSVDGKIGELEKARVGAYEGLQQQVQSLLQTHNELRKETSNLVKALRSPVTRGRWGEIQLKRVVEMAGMIDHCDFFEQVHVEGETGRLRPDMVVRLPGGKSIVVDAKAPLSAYLEALDAPTDELRLGFYQSHAAQVKKHVHMLSQKAYWDQFDAAPEFVVLFLPGEAFFSAALEHDPALIEIGVQQRVILATPTTLISLLRAVAYGWRQETLAENAREVCDLGKLLYNRIADLSSHISDLGQRLGATVNSFNKAVGTLESRVLVSARRFRDLQVGDAEKEIKATESLDLIPRETRAPELFGATVVDKSLDEIV